MVNYLITLMGKLFRDGLEKWKENILISLSIWLVVEK